MNNEDFNVEDYAFLPSLPELCELNFNEVKDQVAYIVTLYGFAMGYLQNVHPAKAWLMFGPDFLKKLGDTVPPSDWEEAKTKIADALERRAQRS